MSTGYSDRCLVIFHQLSKQLCACKHWNFAGNSFHKLRISFIDRSSVYNTVNSVRNVLGTLSVMDDGTFRLQLLCEWRLL